MKRTKRHTIRRIALGLAVAAVIPATAQARPMDLNGEELRAAHAVAASEQLYPGELPAIVPVKQAKSSVEIPYLSHGVGFSTVDLGVGTSSDDRPFSKATSVGAPSISAAGDGNSIDVGTGTVSGLVLLLAAAGAMFIVYNSRKAKLSPA